MAFNLPELPYAYGALEPHIDARTMEIHHGKHHAGYTAKLNKALEGSDLVNKSIESLLTELNSLPENLQGAVRNNGGGFYNHGLFWQMMKADGGGDATHDVGGAITSAFGSFDEFKKQFKAASLTRFGSGWGWLVVNSDGKLEITSSANQDNPITQGLTPVLGVDVWEHAYYLNYQNRRGDYLDHFFEVINWDFVNDLYGAATR